MHTKEADASVDVIQGRFIVMHYSVMVALTLFVCSSLFAQDEESLKKYADQLGLNFGTALGFQFEQGRAENNEIVIREFNTVVAENTMKAVILHAKKGAPDFSRADKVIEFAQQHGIRVRGHTLVWYRQNADWICTGERESTLENMKFHIETVMEHFKGKVMEWDVVNEALEEAPTGQMRDSDWLRSVGPDYVDSAFVYAHRADPDCKLYYNDFGTSVWNAKSDSCYTMLKRMLENGIPIDGVGFQSHQSDADAVPIWESSVKSNFARFAELGLEIGITEIDVVGSDWDKQAQVYGAFMRVALELDAVKSYVIWGVRDKDSWRQPGTPLLFDDDWQPKPAYDTLLYILKNPPSAVEPCPPRIKRQSDVSAGNLIFDNRTKTLSLRDAGNRSAEMPVVIYDLRGICMASTSIHGPSPVSLLSLLKHEFSGTLIVRSDENVLRVNVLR